MESGNILDVPVSSDFALKQFENDGYFATKFKELVAINYHQLMALPKEAFGLTNKHMYHGHRTLDFNPEFWNEQALLDYIPQFKKKPVAEPKLTWWQQLRNYWTA